MQPRFLALGDSYTIGEGVATVERWPEQLCALLRAAGIAIEAPQFVAATGWTTSDLAAALRTRQPEGPFALVSLQIGVNNQYQGGSAEEFAAEFSVLLERAIALAKGDPSHVIVLSIPDWGVTPFAEGRDRGAIEREIDAFNAACLSSVVRTGGPYFVDVTKMSREAAREPGMLTSDGLHPAAPQYAAWAQLALQPARLVLRPQR